MKVKPGTVWTPAMWYNSELYQASYKRIYKAASSTVVDLLGEHSQTPIPEHDKQFAVVRDPYRRAVSIYKQLKHMYSMKVPVSFSDYLDFTLRNGFFDKHQFPQSFWLDGLDIHYFRSDDLPALAAWLGADPAKIKHLNRRPADIELTERDREIIEDLYSEDIALFKTLPPPKTKRLS